MDSRRPNRTVSDPKVRHVGFFTPPTPATASPPTSTDLSPSVTALSPVMIPPPRHNSDTATLSLPHPLPPPPAQTSSIGRDSAPSVASSYSYGEFIHKAKVEASGGGAEGGSAVSSSFPGGGFDLSAVKGARGSVSASVSEKHGGASVEAQSDYPAKSKPAKEKLSKAERRALQEAQRAAKAAAKAEGSKAAPKTAKAPSQKNDFPTSVSEKKISDRPPEKDRKKDVPQPRMQYDDQSRVEKAKKRAVVKQTEVRNRVELFRHLPQYEHGTQLPDLESKFFQLDPMHPAVYKVGMQYLSGDISGGNARCIAMLQAFQEAIKDYTTPPEKVLARDLTAKISSYVSFIIECRPMSVSMGNAIRFLKSRIAKLPITLSESEAKATLQSDIERFINEKIILADKVIVKHAVTKIRDGDVLLTYGSPSVVKMILLHAHELGKQFRVVIVDSRPKLEGQQLLRTLVGKGISCTYTHINAISYIMHEVTRVFLGAASVLSNGTVYSRVGTACVAMAAHAFRIPVLVCCEAYKFHERVQLDSICFNELGDPQVISKVDGREDINYLNGWTSSGNLQLLNLTYDATPSEYISMVVTDYGMIPPTSVPVLVREYRREHLWM